MLSSRLVEEARLMENAKVSVQARVRRGVRQHAQDFSPRGRVRGWLVGCCDLVWAMEGSPFAAAALYTNRSWASRCPKSGVIFGSWAESEDGDQGLPISWGWGGSMGRHIWSV